MEMRIISDSQGTLTVSLHGRLDLTGVGDIEASFKEKVGAANNVIVQMREVSFLASLGMRMLMTAAKILRVKSGKVILVAPQEDVENALRMSGLDQIVPLVDSEAAAVELIK